LREEYSAPQQPKHHAIRKEKENDKEKEKGKEVERPALETKRLRVCPH